MTKEFVQTLKRDEKIVKTKRANKNNSIEWAFLSFALLIPLYNIFTRNYTLKIY